MRRGKLDVMHPMTGEVCMTLSEGDIAGEGAYSCLVCVYYSSERALENAAGNDTDWARLPDSPG